MSEDSDDSINAGYLVQENMQLRVLFRVRKMYGLVGMSMDWHEIRTVKTGSDNHNLSHSKSLNRCFNDVVRKIPKRLRNVKQIAIHGCRCHEYTHQWQRGDEPFAPAERIYCSNGRKAKEEIHSTYS